MTTAEFAKSNMAGLTEPVRIRRYKTMIGVYYPIGYEPQAGTVITSPELNLRLEAQVDERGAAAKS